MTAIPRHASQRDVRFAILRSVLVYLTCAGILTGLLADAVAGLFPTRPEQLTAAAVVVPICAIIAAYVALRRWESKQ